MLCILGFLQMRWSVKGSKQDFSYNVIVFNATNVQYKNAREMKLYNSSISITTKANLRKKSLRSFP